MKSHRSTIKLILASSSIGLHLVDGRDSPARLTSAQGIGRYYLLVGNEGRLQLEVGSKSLGALFRSVQPRKNNAKFVFRSVFWHGWCYVQHETLNCCILQSREPSAQLESQSMCLAGGCSKIVSLLILPDIGMMFF